MEKISLKGNVILVDAAYADSKAGGLSAFLHKRLGRDLPKADLAEWLVCCAIDGGMQPADGEVQVVFVHSQGRTRLQHFSPSDLHAEIDGKAFADGRFGEFVLYAVEDLGHEGDMPLVDESIRAACSDPAVKRLAIVCSQEVAGSAMHGEGVEKAVVMSMEPATTEGKRSQALGYSLLHALGISPGELV